MKKLLTLAAIAAFALVLTGCPKEPGDPTPGKSDPVAETLLATVECIAEYGNYYELPEAVEGKTTLEVTYSWESADGIQCNIQAVSADGKQSSATMSSQKKEKKTLSVACFAGATYNEWVDGKPESRDCDTNAAKLQVYIQNSSYSPVAGTVKIYDVQWK